MKTNWPTKNLEDIAEFQNGLWTGKKAPFVAAPILRNTNFKNGDGSLNYDDVAEIEVEKKQLEKRTLSKGDILLERSGGGPTQPVGRVVYFEGENNRFGFSNFTTRIRVKGSNVDSKYLWFFLHSFYKSGKTELMQKKTTGIRNLTFSEYKQIKIPLLPLEVQKKIVAKVESLLAKVSEAKKLRAEAQENADNLLSAELHKIFTEGKKKGWEEKELGELFDITSSKRVFKSEWTDSGIPFYRARELVSLAKSKPFKTPIYISEELYETYKIKYGAPEEGDILVTGVGTLGISYLVKRNDRFYFKDGNIIWLKKKSDADSRLVEYFFKSPVLKEQIEETAAGATVRTFTIQTAKKVKISLPSLVEQKKIVAHLDSIAQKVQAVKELQNTTENELDVLERSILSKAFSGKLTL